MLHYLQDHALVMMAITITQQPKSVRSVTIRAQLVLNFKSVQLVFHQLKGNLITFHLVALVMSDIMMMDLVRHVKAVIFLV